MPRMIELIRASSVPATLMQSAARGALSVPAPEMMEILVYLAIHNKVFSEQARMTLAGWDESLAKEAASDPGTSKEVLTYLIDPANLRPALLPVLIENPSLGEGMITSLAAAATREQVEILLRSSRANQSLEIMNALRSNPNLRENEATVVQEKLTSLASRETVAAAEPVEGEADSLSDAAIEAFLAEHASEIKGETEKAFQPIGGVYEESSPSTDDQSGKAVAAAAGAESAEGHHEAHRGPQKKWILSADEQRGSALQKISKLDIKGRIQLAMKGNKEERSLLVRDGTKIVALAVLESPKLTDGEVEKFASQKNVLEAVLRAIPMKRRFMKMYPVVRNLTFNPRTPIDVSLGLIKNLLIQDLRHLAGNKEVSDTVRKLAMKMFRQKLDVTKKS